ncbi:hypothetical protein FBUS_03781 [Fasciolopsis buskii]|uniref:Uncharacterized protein n=1 Tax=Fasciolopsis buskii TaxID=27845 RepID=A0A8E0S1Z3_9TREM|nr:hypothetical protein FBUS_03781 [Fasciolopsis buski]
MCSFLSLLSSPPPPPPPPPPRGTLSNHRVEAQRKKRLLTREMDVFKSAHVTFLRNVKNTMNKLKTTKIKLENEASDTPMLIYCKSYGIWVRPLELTLELKTLTQQLQKKTQENASLNKKVLEAHNRLLTRNENSKARLESDSNRLMDLEKQIYMNGCRLKAVLIENARLKWHTTLSLEIVKDVQRKQADEIQTTLTRWKQNNLQLEQMKLAIAPIINALAEALNILA